MEKKSHMNTRYGIGEWYGRRIERLSPTERTKYAAITGLKKEACPHRPGEASLCNKSGGVCSLTTYRKERDGTVVINPNNSELVTLCPLRFWQNYTIFREVGRSILKTDNPILIREIGFLQSVDSTGRISGSTVGRIDMVLAKTDKEDRIENWCALEMQAVYFSGPGMKAEFQAILEQPIHPVFPTAIRRPDFRSSGPKRLMPQLQIKVPSLRRWGKTMAVVIDKSFYGSIAPMKKASDISNADIAWFIVDYDGPNGSLRVSDLILTTLESSVEGLTAGEPLTKEEFEKELLSYLGSRRDKVIRL